MRFISFILLAIITITAFAQEDSKDMQAILDKLNRLEQLKVENENVNSLDLLKQANAAKIQTSTQSETSIKDSSLVDANSFLETETIDTVVMLANIAFDSLEYEIGNISQGEIIKKTYTFTNTGNDDLEIISVVPDCSCTSPEWTQGVIKPGQKGYITAEYDSHDDIGNFLKTITVLHNAGEGYTFLEMRGFVAPKL